MHKLSGKPLDTNQAKPGSKWIFVMSTSKRLYIGEVSSKFQIEYFMRYQLALVSDFTVPQKKKGKFHHSSFLAGGATLAAGRLMAEDGVLKVLSGRFCFSKEKTRQSLVYAEGCSILLCELLRLDRVFYSLSEYHN